MLVCVAARAWTAVQSAHFLLITATASRVCWGRCASVSSSTRRSSAQGPGKVEVARARIFDNNMTNDLCMQEIRTAYRRLAVSAHPDRNLKDTAAATARFQTLQVLSHKKSSASFALAAN